MITINMFQRPNLAGAIEIIIITNRDFKNNLKRKLFVIR